MAEPKPAPLIGAYYYPWYSPSRWVDQPAADTPKLGRYSSRDSTVIQQHIAWAKEADLDFFIVSWLSPEGPEDRNLKGSLMPAFENAHFRFMILYETLLALNWHYNTRVDLDQSLLNGAKAGYTLVEQFEYLADTYFESPSYFRVDGKPVVIVYVMRQMSNAVPYFKFLRQRLAKRGIDLWLIADVVWWDALEKNDWTCIHDNFKAITAYNMYNMSFQPKFLNAVKEQFRVADRVAREHGLQFIPSVMPGYDDTRLRGGGRPILERLDGQFYRNFWNTAAEFVDSAQPFLFITSFNEWHEGSELEPSAEYGESYLKLTREQIASLRKRLNQQR